MREKILDIIEKNSALIWLSWQLSREDEATVANELAAMEEEHVICGYHTLINWDKTSDGKSVSADRGKRNASERSGI